MLDQHWDVSLVRPGLMLTMLDATWMAYVSNVHIGLLYQFNEEVDE